MFECFPMNKTNFKKLIIKFQYLMKDVLRPYVPEYKGQVTSDDGECKRNFFNVNFSYS